MGRKRKASSTAFTTSNSHSTKRKRNNKFPSSDTDKEPVQIGDEEYPINCILDETRTKYLIDWEGPYSPTWEPKECANDAAIEAWEEKKRERAVEPKKQRGQLRRGRQNSGSISSTSGFQHSALDPRTTSPERQQSVRPSPLFVPQETVPETQSPRQTQNAIEGETDRVTPATPILRETTESSTASASSFQPGIASSTTPSNRTTSFVNDTIVSSVEDLSPLHNGSGDFVIPPTQLSHSSPSFVPATSTTGTQSGFTSSSHPQGAVKSQESVKSSLLSFQDTQVSITTSDNVKNEVDEIAETPSTLLQVPDRSGELSQVSSISISSVPYSSSSLSQPHSTYGSGIHTSITGVFVSSQLSSIPETIPGLYHDPATPQLESQNSNSSQGAPTSAGILSQLSKFRAGTMDNQGTDRSTVPPLAEVMEKYSHIPGSTPREKMRSLHAQWRANFNASLQSAGDSATPSSAGDIEPSAPVSGPEAASPLSVRVDKEPASTHAAAPVEPEHPATENFVAPTLPEYSEQPVVQTIQPSDLTVRNAEEVPPGSVQLGPSEFAITLPMDSRVKDDYERVLTDEARNIKKFLTSFVSDPDVGNNEDEHLVPRMYQMIEQLNNIATHPDLNIAEHIKDSASDPEKEAAWAEYSSSKFRFLGHFIEIAENHDLHIIIMVREGKTVEIVERYLLGKEFTYTRPRHEMGGGTNLELSMAKGLLSFGIRSTQTDGIVEAFKRPSAIIALDSSFNAKNPSVEHLRTCYARYGNLLPVIRLLISNTSEHIERCLPNVSELQRLRLLVHSTTRLRDTVGDLQDDALGVHEDAEEVLSYLLSDNFNASWALPTIEPLQIIGQDEVASALGPEPVDTSAEHLPSTTPSMQKRWFDGEEVDVPNAKRQRMTQSQDASQLTDSTRGPSQTLDNDLNTLERNLIQMRDAHAAELRKLQSALADVQSRLQEKEKMLEALQHRYESRTKELHKTRKERDQLAEASVKSEQRLEKQREEIAKLKDERTQLKHDLEAAREALKSGGGTMAELEAAQEEIRRLTKENESLERKAEYEKKQADYTREQYQNASTIAAQSGIEIRQLRNENEELKRKLAGEAIKLKELNIKNDQNTHLSRIAELEATLASREELLHRKEEELRELKKNRPSTRSTSTQPRSPKWAGNSRPTSPSLNNSGLAGRGSSLRFSSEMSL